MTRGLKNFFTGASVLTGILTYFGISIYYDLFLMAVAPFAILFFVGLSNIIGSLIRDF